MAETTFSEIGKTEAVRALFEGSGYGQTDICSFQSSLGKTVQSSVMSVEGIDFDLTYFPLKHLGYKSVIRATGGIYAEMGSPKSLAVRLAVSSKLDFGRIKELWSGITAAAKEHGYVSVSLDLVPSPNGLYISVSAVGERNNLTDKRRPAAKSMDLVCVSGNLGGAFMGLQVLEREKKKFLQEKQDSKQPELSDYKHFVGEYLKPEINPSYVRLLEEDEIIPSYGYFVDRGLSDALKRLTSARSWTSILYPPHSTAGTTAGCSSQFR